MDTRQKVLRIRLRYGQTIGGHFGCSKMLIYQFPFTVQNNVDLIDTKTSSIYKPKTWP
mgnify:CR=1 FL=1